MAVLIIIPLCWIKTLRNLSYVSLLMLIGQFTTFFVIIYFCSQTILIKAGIFNSIDVGHRNFDDIKMIDLYHYPLFIGIGMLSIESNAIAINIRASMKQPEYFNFVYYLTLSITFMLLITIGSLGYIAYGNDTEDLITLNLPNNSLTLGVRLTYCLCLLGTYPVQFVPIIDLIEQSKCYKSLPNLSIIDIKYYTVKTLYVLFTGIMAILIPRLGLFIDLIGSFSCTAIIFVYPILIYEKVFKSQISMTDIIINRLIMVLGITGGCISIIQSLVTLIQAF